MNVSSHSPLTRPVAIIVGLACTLGIAEAAGNGPPTVDANVVNTVDTNVVNTVDANVVGTVDATVSNTVNSHVVNVIPFDAMTGIAFSSNLTLPSTVVAGLPPGKLHALNMSLGSPSTPGDYCTAEAELRLTESGSPSVTKGVAALAARGGSSAVAHDFDTPIEILFDPATDTLSLTIDLDGQDSGAEGCVFSIGLVYEET
jgi:hypothetical protein